jgi:hypothetical protein
MLEFWASVLESLRAGGGVVPALEVALLGTLVLLLLRRRRAARRPARRARAAAGIPARPGGEATRAMAAAAGAGQAGADPAGACPGTISRRIDALAERLRERSAGNRG